MDPITMAGVGSVALTEGIKFLYGQAGEALRRWRSSDDEQSEHLELAQAQLPNDAFQGNIELDQMELDVVGHLEQELRDLRAAVADYAQGIDPVDPSDERLLEALDGLRKAMELVFGQRIIFRGESTSTRDAVVLGEAEIGHLRGYVAGLRAKKIIGGSATGRVSSETVGPGAQAIGLEAHSIGQPPADDDD